MISIPQLLLSRYYFSKLNLPTIIQAMGDNNIPPVTSSMLRVKQSNQLLSIPSTYYTITSKYESAAFLLFERELYSSFTNVWLDDVYSTLLALNLNNQITEVRPAEWHFDPGGVFSQSMIIPPETSIINALYAAYMVRTGWVAKEEEGESLLMYNPYTEEEYIYSSGKCSCGAEEDCCHRAFMRMYVRMTNNAKRFLTLC